MSEITELLERSANDRDALEKLYQRIQTELVSMARRRRRQEGNDPQMETQDLVQESVLRLLKLLPTGAKNRVHLYRLFWTTMKRVLIDHARSANSQKHGEGVPHFELREEDWITEQEAQQILGVGEILEEIDAAFPIQARIYREHYFGGLKPREIVAILEHEQGFQGLEIKTVKKAVAFVDALARDRIQSPRAGETRS